MCFEWLKKVLYGDIFKSDEPTLLDFTFCNSLDKKYIMPISEAILSKNMAIDTGNAVYIWDTAHLPDAFFEWMEDNNISKDSLTHLMLVSDEKYSLMKLDIGLGSDLWKPDEYFIGKSGYIARLYYSQSEERSM